MTPEREEDIRNTLRNTLSCSKPTCDHEGCVAVTLLAELDALRAKVESLGVELCETVAAGDPERYACDKAFKTVLDRGRELGLFTRAPK